MKTDKTQSEEERGPLTRRRFLEVAGAGFAVGVPAGADAQVGIEPQNNPDKSDYLTRDADFGTVERGNPIPYKQAEAKLREIGMTRDTWKLEVVPDLATGSKVDAPMTKERGTALDFAGLMKIAEKRSVRFLKVITCNNLNTPLGMGLWEGVPLRDAIWLAKPVSDIRRVFYYGQHNDDPKQMFRGSLPMGRVLEDPPGEYPIILAYKLNGEWLSGKRGGPVRMIAPENYGFKSVKWIQRVVLTNLPGANDTYADENNDIDSWMKTCARFLTFPEQVRAGAPIPISGVAQVGISGLSKVQVWLHKEGAPLPVADPYFTTAPWKDARMFAPPERWGGGLPDGRIPANTMGFDPQTGKPKSWPLRYSIVHWAALRDVPAGKWEIRCRTIDANGIAQPMPRPLPKSGLNHIDRVAVTVA